MVGQQYFRRHCRMLFSYHSNGSGLPHLRMRIRTPHYPCRVRASTGELSRVHCFIENCCILIEISLNFVPEGSVDITSALVHNVD